jgi:hypothetical protein
MEKMSTFIHFYTNLKKSLVINYRVNTLKILQKVPFPPKEKKWERKKTPFGVCFLYGPFHFLFSYSGFAWDNGNI